MLRILYVTDSLMAGGIESQLVELVTRLDRARFDLHVACLYGPTASDPHFAPHLTAAGVPVYMLDLGMGARDKARAIAALIALTCRLRPDIIQAENYHANLLTRLARPFMPRRTQLIGSVRGILTAKQLRYERLTHRACAHIVASAPFLKRMIETEAHVPGAKIAVAPNSIDVARFASPRDAGLRERIAPGADRVFVTVGRVSRQKTMHLVAQGFGLLKRRGGLPAETRAFIVGPVQDAPMQELLADAIARDDLGAQVIQHGATDAPEDYYHACDVSVLFSTLEGIPCVMLEALAAGRPVIISEEANRAEVITDGETGWIVPTGDVARLAETLARALALTSAELAGMRQACLDRAAEYSVDALVARYTQLYESWVAPSRVARPPQAASVRESPSRSVTRGS